MLPPQASKRGLRFCLSMRMMERSSLAKRFHQSGPFTASQQRLVLSQHSHQTSKFERARSRLYSSQPELSASLTGQGYSTLSGPLVNPEYDARNEDNLSELPIEGQITIPKDPLDVTRQTLVEALTIDLKNSVADIIGTIDKLRTTTSQGGKNDRRRWKKDYSLMDRWTLALNRERERHRRIEERKNVSSRKPFHQLSLDEMWAQAFQGSRLETILDEAEDGSTLNSPESSYDSEEVRSSPLFQVPLDREANFFQEKLAKADSMAAETETIAEVSDDLTIDERIEKNLGDHDSKFFQESFMQALALFSVAQESDWRIFRNCENTPNIVEDENGTTEMIDLSFTEFENGNDAAKRFSTVGNWETNKHSISSCQKLLNFSRENRLMLTTDECNLLLARILTDNTLSEGALLEMSLKLFDDMSHLSNRGLFENSPNSTTFRLLFFALPRRFAAIGEAARICKEMMSSQIDIESEIVFEAMRVCQSYGDFETASAVMESVLLSETRILPSRSSSAIYLDMLKDKNMMEKALEFCDRIKKSKRGRRDLEEELYFQLCRWPKRSRNGDQIDCTLVLRYIMNSIHEAVDHGRKPRFQLYFLLVERLSDASRLDPSLEKDVNRTIRTILNNYKGAWPGLNLLRIGLRSAEVTKDADLISRLIQRELSCMKRGGGGGFEEDRTAISKSSTIPQPVFRKALAIATQNNDVQSATEIFDSFKQAGDEYPTIFRSEVYGFMIRGYAQKGHAQEAMDLLMSMFEVGLKASDEMFADVLRSLIATDRRSEAFAIFNDMNDSRTNHLPLPGVACMDAIISAHVSARDWDEAIAVFLNMEKIGDMPNAQSIHGYLLARLAKDGSSGLSNIVEDFLGRDILMDKSIFMLLARVLVPQFDGVTVSDIRRQARKLSDEQPHVKDACLKLVIDARKAENNERKERSNISSDSSGASISLQTPVPSEAWSRTVYRLLDLSRALVSGKESS